MILVAALAVTVAVVLLFKVFKSAAATVVSATVTAKALPVSPSVFRVAIAVSPNVADTTPVVAALIVFASATVGVPLMVTAAVSNPVSLVPSFNTKAALISVALPVIVPTVEVTKDAVSASTRAISAAVAVVPVIETVILLLLFASTKLTRFAAVSLTDAVITPEV